MPGSMFNQGYYVVGSFQGTLNLGNVEKCDRTGEFCRVVSRMLLTSRGSFDGYLVHYNSKDKPVVRQTRTLVRSAL